MGGADPCDYKAVMDSTTVMVPIFDSPAANSPYTVKEQRLQLNGAEIGAISFSPEPKFYSLTTSEHPVSFARSGNLSLALRQNMAFPVAKQWDN